MKINRLINALGQVNDKYIVEAKPGEEKEKKRKPVNYFHGFIFKKIKIVASFALVIAITMTGIYIMDPFQSKSFDLPADGGFIVLEDGFILNERNGRFSDTIYYFKDNRIVPVEKLQERELNFQTIKNGEIVTASFTLDGVQINGKRRYSLEGITNEFGSFAFYPLMDDNKIIIQHQEINYASIYDFENGETLPVFGPLEEVFDLPFRDDETGWSRILSSVEAVSPDYRYVVYITSRNFFENGKMSELYYYDFLEDKHYPVSDKGIHQSIIEFDSENYFTFELSDRNVTYLYRHDISGKESKEILNSKETDWSALLTYKKGLIINELNGKIIIENAITRHSYLTTQYFDEQRRPVLRVDPSGRYALIFIRSEESEKLVLIDMKNRKEKIFPIDKGSIYSYHFLDSKHIIYNYYLDGILYAEVITVK